MSDPLDRIRAAIDDVNRRLVELVVERSHLVQEAARYKAREGRPFIDLDRESAMIASIVRDNPGPLTDDALASIFQTLFDRSRELAQETGQRHAITSRRPEPETLA